MAAEFYKCPTCKRRSYNANDIADRYCGACHRYEDAPQPAEFDCRECLRHIIALGVGTPPDTGLCAECVHLPGWFKNPKLVATFDPDYDRAELIARARYRRTWRIMMTVCYIGLVIAVALIVVTVADKFL